MSAAGSEGAHEDAELVEQGRVAAAVELCAKVERRGALAVPRAARHRAAHQPVHLLPLVDDHQEPVRRRRAVRRGQRRARQRRRQVARAPGEHDRPPREQQDPVEHGEDGLAWLVERGDEDALVRLRDRAQRLDQPVRGVRIEARGDLIQDQDIGPGRELEGDGDAAALAAGDAGDASAAADGAVRAACRMGGRASVRSMLST